MSEIVEKAIIALADSPLTTKVVIVTGAGSAAGRFLEVLPDVISIAGGVVALLAGGALFFRHRKAGKLVDLRREGVKKQNAHDAKMHTHDAKMKDLELERTRLEFERYKAGEA